MKDTLTTDEIEQVILDEHEREPAQADDLSQSERQAAAMLADVIANGEATPWMLRARGGVVEPPAGSPVAVDALLTVEICDELGTIPAVNDE